MRKTLSVILSVILLFATSASVLADTVLDSLAEYVSDSVPNANVGSVGGEWAVIGLARSGKGADSFFSNYLENAESYVKSKGGILHESKYTEYSRVILALGAVGKDPQNVGGYNLITPLLDYEKTIYQGVNGAVWALIALDSKNYDFEIKDRYIDFILKNQLDNGGFPISPASGVSDYDVTSMAIVALAKYKSDPAVSRAIEKALTYLENVHTKFSSSENFSQAIVVLSTLGIELTDDRFVLNGKTFYDRLLAFSADGGFKHTLNDAESNLMASEQALYALTSLERYKSGRAALYDMTDVSAMSEAAPTFGLSGRHTDVKKTTVVANGKTFSDILYHSDSEKIKALAERGIISGKSESIFDPDNTMTRAEFATIVVRALGLDGDNKKIFGDVNESDWFFSYVAAAYGYGIVAGVSETLFNPYGTITKQEAAVMVARAAALCGMSESLSDSATLDILAGFIDYTDTASWAKPSLAFCYNEGILSDEEIEISPYKTVTRAEISVMLYNLLDKSKLL